MSLCRYASLHIPKTELWRMTVSPVYEDFANLDALAASSQRILKGFPAANDAHTAQLLSKVNASVGSACGSDDTALCEGQVTQTSFHNLQAAITQKRIQ